MGEVADLAVARAKRAQQGAQRLPKARLFALPRLSATRQSL